MVVIVLTDSLLHLQNHKHTPVLQVEIGTVLVSDTKEHLILHYRMGGVIGHVALLYFHISVVN